MGNIQRVVVSIGKNRLEDCSHACDHGKHCSVVRCDSYPYVTQVLVSFSSKKLVDIIQRKFLTVPLDSLQPLF